MYNAQDHSVLYNNAQHSIICKACHITHRWKAVAWQDHITKRGGLGP